MKVPAIRVHYQQPIEFCILHVSDDGEIMTFWSKIDVRRQSTLVDGMD